MRDIANNLNVVASLVPAVQTAAADGTAVDLQGYGSAALLVQTGAIVSAGDFGIKLQESDASGSGFTDVASTHLIGTLPATLVASTVYEQGYRINKRYVRAVTTKAGGTSIALGAMIVRGMPHNAPVA
jgi:hypothetical protein